MPLKSFEYWVVVQLALDLGLFLLLVFLIVKMRALRRLLNTPHPAGGPFADELAELTQKLAGLEHRFHSWVMQPPAGMASFPQQMNSEFQDRERQFFPSEVHPGKSLRAQVEDLAGRGLSPEEIARQLHIQLAEVKIALDLSRILSK